VRIAADIIARDVFYEYAQGKNLAIKNVNLKILTGEFVAIIGPNGIRYNHLTNLKFPHKNTCLNHG
jgi:energy-coupling factor transport system ATP-binding protein